MNSFLQQVAQSVIDSIDWKQLNRTTLVLPSHRAGLVLKDELLRLQQERHAQAIWAPQVQTLTQLQESLSPLYAEDELFTIVRLYKLYRQSSIVTGSELMPLDMFYGWGRQMISDFTNVDASMPAEQVPNFFANTVAAHELSQWQLDPETEERLRGLMANGSTDEWQKDENSIRAQYEFLWRRIHELYTALRAEMTAEQKGYAGLRQRAVIENWDSEYVQSKIAGRTYIFVGFNYLLPVERDLMMRLRDNGQARFYWDFVRDFETNSKAFSFAELNSGILGNALSPVAQSRLSEHPSEVTVVECVSREAQAQYVHRWLQENYTAKGQKVGVVICDENMLESVIYTLPAITPEGESEPAPINITKGFPLRNTAIYARVLRWLGDRLRGNADDVVAPEIIDEMVKNVLTEFSDISENEEQSNQLSWQELLILESDYQVRKIANQMRLLITGGLGDVPFTLRLLRLLMRRMMENVTMPFHGEPVTDVQIMGVLETRLLDFDRLLLLNVEEGIIPQKQVDNSFIPFYLRKAYHMQTSDEKATIYAYNFFRLLSRAGHSTLLYASAETSEGGKGMSRFILQMLYSPQFNVQKLRLEESNTFTMRELVLPTTQRAHFKRLSPSALNTYISCPYQFYLQYVLGIRPKEEESVLFKSNTKGSFVHHTMEHIYREYLHCDGKSLVRISPGEIEAVRTSEQRLDEALLAAYDSMNKEWMKDYPDEPNHYLPEHHRAENVEIKGFVKNILERDREDAKTGLYVYKLEHPYYFSVPIDGVGDIEVGGKVDRLDIYGSEGNQHLRIVDYKSGGYNDKTHDEKMSSSWEDMMDSDQKAYVRQTLIYSHAVNENDNQGLPIEPQLFFCKRKLTDIVTTIDVAGETVHDYATIKDTFFHALQTKIKQILDATDFPKCEPDQCPSYCPFITFCGRKNKES